jgi:hypothetical protein
MKYGGKPRVDFVAPWSSAGDAECHIITDD